MPRITSPECLSETQYIRLGRPKWWARIGDEFLPVPHTPGNRILDFEWDDERRARPYTVHYGVGPKDRNASIRRTKTFVSKKVLDGPGE